MARNYLDYDFRDKRSRGMTRSAFIPHDCNGLLIKKMYPYKGTKHKYFRETT